MRKYPRIEIDQKAYDGLSIEAVLQHRTVREIATEAILGHISREALSVLDHKTTGPETTAPEDIATKRPLDHKTTEGAATATSGPDVSQKRKRLAEDTDAINQVKSMWQAGEKSPTVIGKAINYPRSTTSEMLKRMRESGELVD